MIINISDKYNCYIGENILNDNDLKDEINKILNDTEKILIVQDQNVSKEYKEKVYQLFNGYSLYIYELEACEELKTINEFENIQKYLLACMFTRKDCIVSIGGGMISDLVGFVASTYKRGIKDIYFPTTTLSMIDASIGGKVAVNLDNTKNVIGTFYNPSLVVSDISALDSLDKRNFNAGLVEALKMGLTIDKSLYELFLPLLENNIPNNLDILSIIQKSVQAKKQIVEQDYKDEGIREILNFGHTIAHAVELKYNYLHGECVAFGMIKNILNEELKNKVLKMISKLEIDIEEMNNKIDFANLNYSNDKKILDGKVRESYLLDLNKIEFR